ncbi:RING-type domain-containing protein [Pleurotus pulmonarius]
MDSRMQETARPRSSKRSIGKPSSVSQSTAQPASGSAAAPPRHRKSERLDSAQRDPPSVSTTSAIVRDEPRTAIHPCHGHQKKKDRTSSPDRRHSTHSTRSHRIKALPSVPDDPEVDRKSGSMWRTLDEAQYEQAKKEAEELRKSASDTKKLLKKQSKHIQELNAQITALNQAKKEQELQYQLLKTKASKHEELVSTIETSLQCQICIDTMTKPQALAPCGHVFCLSCLQAWFSKGPSSDDGSEDPVLDPEYIMSRPKSCPCCRASVTKKPAPIFVIRDIALAVNKAKNGIFPSSDDEDDIYDPDFMDEYGPGDQIIDPGMLDMFMGHWGGIGIDSDSDIDDLGGIRGARISDDDEDDDDEEDEEDDDSESAFDREELYIPMRWEPPTVPAADISRRLLDTVPEHVGKLLRRGCPLSMIQAYHMTYSHERGITATVERVRTRDHVLPGRLTLFLGWNIEHHESSDEAFIDKMLADLSDHPERWNMIEAAAGGDNWEAHRLVSLPNADSDEYDMSESDAEMQDF